MNLHQRKFLELARALASEPRLVMLDEVLSGLTPSEMAAATRLVRDIRDRGTTVVFVEHIMRAVMALADRVVVLDAGQVIASGAPQDVMRHPDVVRALPGEGPCLRPSGSQVAYGDATALWDVSLSVRPGELVSVVGPNGSGKTTLINAIAGLLRVRGGRLRFHGEDLTRLAPHEVSGRGIAIVPEGRRLFAGMTVEENLEIGCYARGRARLAARASRACTRCSRSSGQRRRQAAGTLSGGQQQMVAIGRALMAGPRLLLLDEPSLGLAPSIVDHVFEAIEALHQGGRGGAPRRAERRRRRWRWRPAPTCWRRAASWRRARRPTCSREPHIRSAYLGEGGP